MARGRASTSSLGGRRTPAGRKPTLLARGKPRTLGGSARPWRVRLYAPEPGGTKYQVMFRAPADEGEPWKRVLRRASSEDEARKIFARAKAAFDTESETPGAAERTIQVLSEEYLAGGEHYRRAAKRLAGMRKLARTPDSAAWVDALISDLREEHKRRSRLQRGSSPPGSADLGRVRTRQA